MLLWLPIDAFGSGIRIGLGATAGIAMPATGGLTHVSMFSSGASDQSSYLVGDLNFRGKEAGPEYGGELTVGANQFEIAFGVSRYSRLIGGAPLQDIKASTSFRRTLTASMLSFRYFPPIPSQISPYIGAGLGVYTLREAGSDLSFDESRFDLGVLGTVGLEAGLGGDNTRLFTEARIHYVEFCSESNPFAKGPGELITQRSSEIGTFGISVGLRFRY